VGFGEIALIGRGLDTVDRQTGQNLPAPAERIAVGGQHRPAIRLDPPGQIHHAGRRAPLGQGLRGNTTGAGLGFRLLGATRLLGALGFGHTTSNRDLSGPER
jgi:hypothetical protein